jgi:DnaK suppressor protein
MTKTGNPPIAPGELEGFRAALRHKEEELRERLSAARAAEVVHRPEEPLDFGDWCQKNHDEWLFLNQNRLEMALLREIQAALRRLGEGSYGVCQECSQPLSARRLDAVPWARFCAPCQEKTVEFASRD